MELRYWEDKGHAGEFSKSLLKVRYARHNDHHMHYGHRTHNKVVTYWDVTWSLDNFTKYAWLWRHVVLISHVHCLQWHVEWISHVQCLQWHVELIKQYLSRQHIYSERRGFPAPQINQKHSWWWLRSRLHDEYWPGAASIILGSPRICKRLHVMS